MITVARILRSQGREGQVRVRFHHSKPADGFDFSRVSIGKGGKLKEYEVESLISRGKDFDLKLKGVDTLSAADELAAADVYVPEESLKKPNRGEFFLFELVGCAVLDRQGSTAGRVTDVLSAGGAELLVLDREGKEILVPFHESICVEVDVAGKKIVIDPPEGLLDLNEI